MQPPPAWKQSNKHGRVYLSQLASKSDPSQAVTISTGGEIGSVSQQDQSPAGLFIKISNQSVGGADFQLSHTKEAVHGPRREGAVLPLSASSLARCHPLSRFGNGEMFSPLSQCGSVSYRYVLDRELQVLLPTPAETGTAFRHDDVLNGIWQRQQVGHQN